MPGQQPAQPGYQQFAQRGVEVQVEGTGVVVRGLAGEVGLVPNHPAGGADLYTVLSVAHWNIAVPCRA